MNESIYTIDLLKPCTTVSSDPTVLQRVADILSYPLIIRPSTNNAEKNIKIISNPDELMDYFK